MPNSPEVLKVEDAAWVANLCHLAIPQKGWTPSSLERFFKSGGYGYHHSQSSCILLKGAKGYAELVLLATLPEARYQGLAKQLWQHAIEATRLKEVVLEVSESNNAAIACYEKFAFKPLGLRKNYYQDGRHAITMRWDYSSG